MYTDVILSFDFGGDVDNYLISTKKFKETVFDVQYVQLVDICPETSPHPYVVFLDLAQSESNIDFGYRGMRIYKEFGSAIGLSNGGGISRDFPRVKVSKANIDAVTCYLVYSDNAFFSDGRQRNLRVHIRIFHGLPKIEMKKRSFLLQLNRSADRKLYKVDYKLKDPIHNATAIRVHGWASDGTYHCDFVSCPLVNSKPYTNASEVDDGFIAFGHAGKTMDYGTYQIKPSNSTINNIPILIKKLGGATYTKSYASIHLTIYEGASPPSPPPPPPMDDLGTLSSTK